MDTAPAKRGIGASVHFLRAPAPAFESLPGSCHSHIVVSLVAEDADSVIGHIMFSPVVLIDYPRLKVMGLAPMAVAPKHQRKGVGSALVRAGLEECRKLGVGAVVVLGHSSDYPKL